MAVELVRAVPAAACLNERHITGNPTKWNDPAGEYLDKTLFWTAADLDEKLRVFQHYFNRHRAHSGLKGRTARTW